MVTADLPASFAEALAADDPEGAIPAFLVDALPAPDYDVYGLHDHSGATDGADCRDGDVIDLGDRVLRARPPARAHARLGRALRQRSRCPLHR